MSLRGYYLGEASLNGQEVHPLAFRQANLDWQIWIYAGSNPYDSQTRYHLSLN